MEQKKSLSKSIAMTLALVMLLPVIAVIVAACGAKVVYHKVTFYSDDKTTILGYAKVEDGKEAKLATTPTKAQTARYYYVFSAWLDEDGVVADLTSVKEDMKVYAYFEQKLVEYTLTKPSQVTVTRGTSALQDGAILYYGDKITVTYTESAGKKKSVFKINGTNVPTNGVVYEAKGNVEIVYQEVSDGTVVPPITSAYNVKFYGPDGNVVGTQEVEAGHKATKVNFQSAEYQLLKWDYDFDQVVTSDVEINGFFVKNSERIAGVSAVFEGDLGSGAIDSYVLTVKFDKDNALYQYLVQDTGFADLPTEMAFKFMNLDRDVTNSDRARWGDIDFSVNLHNDELDYGFWAGAFSDARVLSIEVPGAGLASNNIYVTFDNGENNTDGVCHAYTNVYGIKTPVEVESDKKYEGVELIAPEGQSNVWTLRLGKNNPIYDFFVSEVGEENVTDEVQLTVSQTEMDDWDRVYFGNVDQVLKAQIVGTERYFEIGYYLYNDVFSIDSTDLGIGVSNIYFVREKDTSVYYLYENVFGLNEALATVNFVDLNGVNIVSSRSRVGAKLPTLNYKSDIEGYSFVRWDADYNNVRVQSGTNYVCAIYVKESEKEDVTLTVDTHMGWVNEGHIVTIEMAADSALYQYLSKYLGDSISTELSLVVTEDILINDDNKFLYERLIAQLGDISYCYKVAYLIDGENSESVQFTIGALFDVHYTYNVNMIVVNLSDTTNPSDRSYFVQTSTVGDESKTVFAYYKNIYSFSNYNG